MRIIGLLYYRGKEEGFHAPFDKELNAEGGLRRIAIRSTFTPGTVKVFAATSSLMEGQTEFKTLPADQ